MFGSLPYSSWKNLTVVHSLAITWVLWLAAAAAITQTLGGSLNCSHETFFIYCGQLNALEGFAWLIWFVLFLCWFRNILTLHKGTAHTYFGGSPCSWNHVCEEWRRLPRRSCRGINDLFPTNSCAANTFHVPNEHGTFKSDSV